jgi:hypothetical protein
MYRSQARDVLLRTLPAAQRVSIKLTRKWLS